jgi:hypothetical protein
MTRVTAITASADDSCNSLAIGCGAPDMTKTVTDGNGTTHFFDVFDGKSVLGTAMAFLPAGAGMPESVPMAVYYHGHNSQNSIEGYIKAMKQRDFRPLLASKKVLWVEPWGGTLSKFGTLATGTGLTTLIESAMFTAISYGRPSRPCPVKPPPPPSLILAGFSGGGASLNALVKSSSTYLSRLTEAWAFDCLYSEEGQKRTWVDWANANTGKTLRVRVSTGEITGSPRRENKIINAAGVSNIDSDDPVTSGHEDCPGKFIPQWL